MLTAMTSDLLSGMLHTEEFIDADTDWALFSLQRYFSLDKGILKYGKCIADVSIKIPCSNFCAVTPEEPQQQ